MRKFFVILSLIVLVVAQVGSYCVFQYRQYRLKEETKANLLHNLPDEELTVFNLYQIKDLVEWKGDDEFSLDGKMYDLVKRVDSSAGETLIYAVADTNEDALLAKYAASAHHDSGKKQSSGSLFLFLLYPPAEKSTTNIFGSQRDKIIVPLSANTLKGFQSSFYAPPRSV